MSNEEDKDLDVFLTGCFLVNGKQGSLKLLRQTITNEGGKLGITLVFNTFASEKLYVLHKSTLEKILDGDTSKVKQLLKVD